MFGSASRRELAVAIDDLRKMSDGDLLRLKPDEIVLAGRALAPSNRRRLLPALVDAAIADDAARLAAAARAFGREMMPPARLIGDWALSMGMTAKLLNEVVASAEAPAALVGELLKAGPIGVGETVMLGDVAAAYAGDRNLALDWIKLGVEREIDRYASLAKRRARPAGLWQRLRAVLRPGQSLPGRSLTDS